MHGCCHQPASAARGCTHAVQSLVESRMHQPSLLWPLPPVLAHAQLFSSPRLNNWAELLFIDCTISPAQRNTWHNYCSSGKGLQISEVQRGTLSVHLRPLRSMGTRHISCLLLTCKLARNLGTTCGSVRRPVTRGTGQSTLAPSASPLLCNSLTRPCVLACRSTVLLNLSLQRYGSLCRSSQQLSLPYGQPTHMSYG